MCFVSHPSAMDSAKVFVSIPRKIFSRHMLSADLGLKQQGMVGEAVVNNYHPVQNKFARRDCCTLFRFTFVCWGYLMQGLQSCPSDHRKASSSALKHIFSF